jgi:D-arabinose 5-phosphate isomerase GutQ
MDDLAMSALDPYVETRQSIQPGSKLQHRRGPSLGNALALCLMQARGFTDRGFARCHPGGRLGARLNDDEQR